MPTPRPHDIIHEGDGVGVLLSNGPDRVWLDRDDYVRVVQDGERNFAWVVVDQYVRTVSGSKNVPLARLVLESDGTGYVNYREGDRLNLRRTNLRIGDRYDLGGVMKRPWRSAISPR